MANKPTKKKIKDAVALLAQGDVIGNLEAVLLAAGCTNFVIGGRTKMGNGFTMTNNTDRFVRGMVRKALKADTDEPRALSPRAAALDSVGKRFG